MCVRDADRTRSFKHDPFGRGIYKSSSSATSVFGYDGDNLIEGTNPCGALAARLLATEQQTARSVRFAGSDPTLPRNLRILFVGVMTAACMALVAYATSTQSLTRTLLLDVVRNSWDAERNETLVYLRVHSYGLAEAHPMRKVDFRDVRFASKQLAPDEVSALKRLLSEPATMQLQTNYSKYWGNKDFGYKYTVTLYGPPRKQIELINFQPFLARKEGKPYPKQLERLGCSIWRLRAEVSGEALEKDWLNGYKELGY